MISSVAGVMPAPLAAPYCASKHALHGFFSSMRAELAAQHYHNGAPEVSVTLACPGPVVSPGSACAILSERDDCATFTQTTGVQLSQRGRMPAERCAELALAAAGARLPESWMGPRPALVMAYVSWLCPSVRHAILPAAAFVRATNLRTGSESLSKGLVPAVLYRVCSCEAFFGAASWVLDLFSLACCACGHRRFLRSVFRCLMCRCGTRNSRQEAGEKKKMLHTKMH